MKPLDFYLLCGVLMAENGSRLSAHHAHIVVIKYFVLCAAAMYVRWLVVLLENTKVTKLQFHVFDRSEIHVQDIAAFWWDLHHFRCTFPNFNFQMFRIVEFSYFQI